MITFDDFLKIFNFDSDIDFSIEIEFEIINNNNFKPCFMGKIKQDKVTYWYALDPDGKNSYDYDNLEDFINASIFDGKSLKKVFNQIRIISIDGCEPEFRIEFYKKYKFNN